MSERGRREGPKDVAPVTLPPPHASRARSKKSSSVTVGSVIDVIPIATCICDATGGIEQFNQRFRDLFGDVAIGIPLSSLLERARTPNGDRIARSIFEDTAPGGRPIECEEIIIQHAESGHSTVLVSVATIRDSSGQPTGSIASFYDITERVRASAEYAGRRRADRLQELTAALSMASTVTEVAAAAVEHATGAFDAKGSVIARLSDDGRELLLMDAVEMPDHLRDAWQSFPVDANAPLSDVARSGVPMFLESRSDWEAHYPHLVSMLDETGHEANIVVPIVVEGRTIGAMGVAFGESRFFDESDRTLANAIAQQAGLALERARLYETAENSRIRADDANLAKTQFLTTISHELRTPLNAIAGYADLLSLSLYGPVTDAQVDALDRIKRSQRHLLSLIDDMLNFAKIDAGHLQVPLGEVDVGKACQDVEALVEPQLRAKGLRHVIESREGLIAWANEERLRQVLVNLVGNAIKFTPGGGTISVRGREDGKRVLIEVHDTGIGIPAEKIERIFEPFVQLDRSLTSGQEGAGLGLAISRELVRLMKGELTVVSSAGRGSVFTVSLPRVV